MLFSEPVRLAMLKAVGAEEFDTGRPEFLWAVLSGEFEEAFSGAHSTSVEIVGLKCRSSDVTAHDLKRDGTVRRVSDDSVFRIKRFEPSRSSGFTRVVLKQ